MITKTVAQLDKNGFYVGLTIADESPLEPGVYLLPAGAVDAQPPSIPEGKFAKWDAGWQFFAIVLPEPPAGAAQSVPLPAPPKQFTSLEYLDLFTEDEQIAVVSATMVNAQIKLWYDKMLAAGFVTIADPRTKAGLAALVSAGLITAERKAVIVGVMS